MVSDSEFIYTPGYGCSLINTFVISFVGIVMASYFTFYCGMLKSTRGYKISCILYPIYYLRHLINVYISSNIIKFKISYLGIKMHIISHILSRVLQDAISCVLYA